MSNLSILLDLAIGTLLISIGIGLLCLVLSLPFVAIPAAGFLGTGFCVFARGWSHAWSDLESD